MKGGENMKKLLMVVAVAALILSAFPQSPVNAEVPGSDEEWQSDAPPGQEEAPPGQEEEGYTNPSPRTEEEQSEPEEPSWTEEEQSEPEEEVETPESQQQDSDEQGD
jgi:hypothetical protein